MIKVIHEDVYETKTIFVYNCSVEEANKVFKKYKCKEIPNTVDGNYEAANIYEKLIYISDIKNINVLVHEVMHLVFNILTERGIYLNYGEEQINDEPFTYLVGYYFKSLKKEYEA